MAIDVRELPDIQAEADNRPDQEGQPEQRRGALARLSAARRATTARLSSAMGVLNTLRERNPDAGVERDIGNAQVLTADYDSVAEEAEAYLRSLEAENNSPEDITGDSSPARIDDIRDLRTFIDHPLPQGADPLSRLEATSRTMRFLSREDANGNPGKWQDGVELIAYPPENTNHSVTYMDSKGESHALPIAATIENYHEERDPQRGPMRRDSLIIGKDGTVLVRVAERTKGKWTNTIVEADENDIAQALDTVNELAMLEHDRIEQKRLTDKKNQPAPTTDQNNTPPPDPDNGTPDGDTSSNRHRRNLRTRIAAAGAAAAMAAGAVLSGGHGTRPSEVQPPPAASQTTEQPYQSASGPTEKVVGEITEVTPVTESLKVLEKYAREFSADPEAGKLVHPSDVSKIMNIYEELQQAGVNVDTISFQGHASAEDANPVEAGITTLSPDNEKLAQKRETTLENWVKQQFKDSHLPTPQLELLKGVEDNLKPHGKEMGSLMRLAKESGYPTIAAMIDSYNADAENCPPKVQRELLRVLNDQRYVDVVFKGEQITEIPITISVPNIDLIPQHHLHIPLLGGNLGYLPDNITMQRPDRQAPQNGPIGKASRGFGTPVERNKQPRKTYNTNKNRGNTYERHRTGKRIAKN